MAIRSEPNTADQWMARLRSDHATARDHESYERWLDAQPENREAAESLDEVWHLMGVLEHDPMVQEVLAEPPPRRIPLAESPALRLAAAALLCLTVAAAWLTWRTLDSVTGYETASGEQRVVDLEDGSRLHLNVATRLEVKLLGDVRDVQLVHGQAFFEVVPDPDRPFVVTAGDKEITVLGTKFDVLLQEGETRVTVIEGRVAVTSLDDVAVAQASPPSLPQDPSEAETPETQSVDAPVVDGPLQIELTTRDAVRWPRGAAPSSLAPTAAIASVEAWLSGKVEFDNTPLEEAVAELDRYTPVRVRLASDELRALTVSGVFYVDRLAQVDSLVFALENSLPITVEQRAGELLLLASD